MKKFILGLSLSLAAVHADAGTLIPPLGQWQQKDVTVSVNDAFVPGSVKASDEAFTVVSGLFPNGCYRWKRAEVATETQQNVIEIRSVATVSQGMCIMVMVPFSSEIKLGTLSPGTHTLRFVNGDGTYMEKTLTVE